MSDDSVIAEFQNITGCDVERAKFYLESANNQLDLAISNFYESDGMEVSEPVPEEPPQMNAAAGGPPPSGAAGGRAAAAKSRINFPESDSEDSDDEGGKESYAGGSTSSGNVVIGPGKKGKKDIVGKLFRRAKESGAEEVQPGEFGASGSSGAFLGGGFKLGGENTPSVAVGTPSEPTEQPRTFVLKMWQDGFSIDDGELREYSNPTNREFLASIMKGTIPTELVREAKGGEVHVDMEDHRQEEFVKPKVSAKPFQGAGNTLGSIAPQVTATAPTSASADPAADENKAKAQAKVDDSKPTSNVQVRLADGSRLVVRLNHEHTVADLRNYICTARSQYSSSLFSLLTTFPNKELTDETQSLKDAGLLGAAVLQRLK